MASALVPLLYIWLAFMAAQVVIWLLKGLWNSRGIIAGIVMAVIVVCLFSPFAAAAGPAGLLLLYVIFRDNSKNGSSL